MTTDTSPGPIEDASVPADAAPSGPPPQHNTWISVLVTTVGAIVILAMVTQAVVVGVTSGSRSENATYTAAIDGVTSLDVDVSAADLTVRFADVDDARLDVTSTGWRRDHQWLLETDGDRLQVTDGGDVWFWPTLGSTRTTAELVLPVELDGMLDVDVDVSAGDVDIAGDLGLVELELNAGSLTLDGASESLVARVDAGTATVRTDSPSTVTIDVNAGRFSGEITGEQPDSTQVEVNAGNATLNLPQGTYAVSGEANAGDRTIDLRTDPSSEYFLEVIVNAGSAIVGYAP